MAKEKNWVQTDLEPKVYEAFAQLAEKNERSIRAQLRVAVKDNIERDGGGLDAAEAATGEAAR